MPKATGVSGPLILAGALSTLLGVVLLALTHLQESGEPGPSLVRVTGSVTVLFGLALATTGLGMLVFAPLHGGPVAASNGFGSHRVILTATLFATTLAFLVSNLLPLIVLGLTGERNLRNVPGFLSAASGVNVVLLGVVYLRFVRPRVVNWADLGLAPNRQADPNAKPAWLTDLANGVGGGVLVVVVSALVQSALRSLGVQQTQLQEFTWIRELPPAQFGLVFLTGAVVAPFAEELYFRGLVFGSYLRAKGPLTAYLVSSAVFASLHLNLPAFPPILVLGLMLAWLYRATGSLVPCIIAHGFNNGLAFLALYFAPDGLMPGGG